MSSKSLQLSSVNEEQANGHRAAPDISRIMREIRERVRLNVNENRDRLPEFKPFEVSEVQFTRKAGELLHSEELRYLNGHYSFARLDLNSVVTHRTGLIGKLIVKVKRRLLRIVWDNLLKDYFEREREYQANLVRFLNDAAKYVDSRDASNFWELIRKIDNDVTKALERIEILNDEASASIRSTERRVFDTVNETLEGIKQRITELQAVGAQQSQQLKTQDGVVKGLEAIAAQWGRGAEGGYGQGAVLVAGNTSVAGHAPEVPDFSYLLLENRYRGSEAEIAERLRIYPEIFSNAKASVLEIGSGRGELLELFKSAGVNAYGVDIDRAMAETASNRGLDARFGDALAHLQELPPGSLGGVIAVQVVEHLTREQLQRLFENCCEKIVPGGKVVFETINPRSLVALSSNYFRDPTHVWPLHPDTLEYMLTLAGLRVCEVRMLSKIPDDALLKQVPVESYMTPRWQATVELLNHNINQMNDLMYGFQDYCVIAEVPAGEANSG